MQKLARTIKIKQKPHKNGIINWTNITETDENQKGMINISLKKFFDDYKSVQKWLCEDERIFGDFFFRMVDEIEDISFNHAVRLITDLLLQSVKEIFGFTDSQLDMLADSFYKKFLPCYQSALKRAA